jgi:hypothetical protein
MIAAAHGPWPKLSLDHPIMCYRGKVVFFFLPLDGLGPRLAML